MGLGWEEFGGPECFLLLCGRVGRAGFMANRRKKLDRSTLGIPAPPLTTILPLIILWMLPMGLLIIQRDLGMIIQLNIILLVVWIVATGHWGILFPAAAARTARCNAHGFALLIPSGLS